MLAETMSNIWFAIYLNLATSALNAIGTILLMWGAANVRRAARLNAEMAKRLGLRFTDQQ